MRVEWENDAARTEPGTLESAAHELELLRDAAGLIGRSLDLQDIYDSLWRIVSRAMDCDAMFVSSFDPDGELIRCVFAQVEGNRLDPSGFPPIPLEPEGQGTQSLVIRSGEPLVIGDFRTRLQGTTTSFAVSPGGELVDDEEVPEEEGIRSAVIVSITFEGRVIGVTQVQSTRLDAYTSEHRRILGALMDQVAVATTNAHLYEQAKASEERFRLIATVTNDVLWEWDVAGETIRWNEAIESLVGRSSDEIRSFEVWADLVHPDDRERVVTGLRDAVAASANRWSDEYRMRHADGSYRTVFDRGHIVREAGPFPWSGRSWT